MTIGSLRAVLSGPVGTAIGSPHAGHLTSTGRIFTGQAGGVASVCMLLLEPLARRFAAVAEPRHASD